jgi:hypothetical protein
VANCLIAQMATLPCQYNYPLGPFGELAHGTIFHDAGDATSEARWVRRPNRVMANRTAPPTRVSARRPSCKNGCQPLYCVMRAMS